MAPFTQHNVLKVVPWVVPSRHMCYGSGGPSGLQLPPCWGNGKFASTFCLMPNPMVGFCGCLRPSACWGSGQTWLCNTLMMMPRVTFPASAHPGARVLVLFRPTAFHFAGEPRVHSVALPAVDDSQEGLCGHSAAHPLRFQQTFWPQVCLHVVE